MASINILLMRTMPAVAQPARTLPDSLIYYWHQVYFAEMANDPDAIIAGYERVLELSATLPPSLKQWYRGTAFFGIAKANSLIGDRAATKELLDSALHEHFWNFDMIRNVPTFSVVLGKSFVDSLCTSWRERVVAQARTWPAQDPIILKPTKMIRGKKYPLIIALHGGGGSYEAFSYRLGDLPDSLNAIVAFLPGILRLSETSNAWGMNMEQCVPYVDLLVSHILADPAIDSSDVTMMGYSQGSQVSYAYALAHPERVRRVVAFAGFANSILPSEHLETQLQSMAKHKVRIVAISGDRDYSEFINTTKAFREKAKKAGVRFSYTIEPGLPHGIPEHATTYIGNLWRKEHY
ncbi:MAG: alpha/beta fold hydrolase [Bacteroidetes bacterium]|nr:alpha/beta fold hydrolase [Bacteroidota bacterium]